MQEQFKLKQHTPIIHFQYDQNGATLRASEVKPKLDRYILTVLGDNNYKKGIQIAKDKHLLLGKNEHPSLDYKLRFKTNGNPDVWDCRIPGYFAEIGDDVQSPKKLVFFPEGITMEVFTLNPNVLGIIKENIAGFFMTNNFGTRQSKGFGSFFLESGKPDQKIYSEHFQVSVKGKLDENYFEELFKYIDYFYKTIRSGINQPNKEASQSFYCKSLMFQFAKSKSLQWDKKTIRYHFEHFKPKYEELKNNPKRQDPDSPFNVELEGPKYLFRDLLGLSTIQSWKYYDDTIKKEYVNNGNDNSSIERFQSPITFKPILGDGCCTIYVILKEIPNKMLNATFEIYSDSKQKVAPLELKTYKDFNLEEYWEFIKKWDISQSVNNTSHYIFTKYLKPIYEELNNQK